MYGFEPVEEENTQYNTESHGPSLFADKKPKKSELAPSNNDAKKDQSPLPTKKIYQDLPMSLNLCEKYEPQDFSTQLRKPHMTKFEEELLKIRLSTEALVRNEQDEVKKNQEFESKRLKDSQERSKRIPKQSILAKIEEIHKKKYPQFKVEMFLKPNVDDDSLDLPHDLYIQNQEKKIQEKISKKNALQRQQDVLIQQLTPMTRKKIGFNFKSKKEKEESDQQSEDQLEEQQATTFNMDISKTPNENLQLQANTTPRTLMSTKPKNEEITNPTNNISPPKIRPWQQLLQQRQMRSTSAHFARSKNNNSFLSKRDNIFTIDSSQQNKIEKPNIKINSISHTTTPTNTKVLFPRGSIRFQQGQLLNTQEQQTESNTQQQPSIYLKAFQTELAAKTIPINILPPKEVSQERPKKKTKIELDRERRRTSPLKFLFTKYENIVQDGYDDYKAEMKDIADMYLADPPKTRKPARSQQQRKNPNRNLSDSLTPNSRQKQLSFLRVQQEQKQQELQQQQQSPRHGQQKNQQPISHPRDPNSFEGMLQSQQYNSNKLGFQDKRAATSISVEKQSYESKQSQASQLQKHKKERSRFLDRNRLIKLKNEELSKTLQEFIADDSELRQAAKDFKKMSAENTNRLEQILQPQRMSETYNVTDFLHRIRQEQQLQQNKVNDAIKEEMNKTQGNYQFKNVTNTKKVQLVTQKI